MPDPGARPPLTATLLPVLQALLPSPAAPRSPVNVRVQFDIGELWQWATANADAVAEAA